jgi:hypothetical protein
MNNLKKKNNSISTSKTKLTNSTNLNNYNKSENNFRCIGPCYSPKTTYYHPLYFDVIYDLNDYTCPIRRTIKEGKEILNDFCDPKQVTYDPNTFDMFEDIVQIANTPKLFLEQIYKIDDLQDCIKYLNDNFDNIPIYSQKRMINAIVEAWGKNINFPLDIVSHKIKFILHKIYHIDLTTDKISKKIINIINKQNYNDIFIYFMKYTK